MDVEVILNKLADFGYVRLNKPTGDWYSVYCPFHSDGQERRPSCGVSLVEQYKAGQVYPQGMWHCFTCSAAYDMPTAITKIFESKGLDQVGEEWLKLNIPGYEPVQDFDYLLDPSTMDIISSKFAIKDVQSRLESSHDYVSEEELASYRYVVPYMKERKLTDQIIEMYDVGYDAKFVPPGRKRPVPCITIPVRDRSGNTLFLCRRSVKGKMYHYPEGVTKPVFGIDVIPSETRSLVICESAINAMTSMSYGYPAVALLGTGNRYQTNQLKTLGVDSFVLCMDGDVAGRRASARIKKNLSDVAMVWTIEMPDGKDLNDLSKEEFIQLYDSRV